MKQESTAVLLRIFIGESDQYNGQTLYEYLVMYLRKHHFAGVTVLRGLEGYGHSSMIHTANVLDLSTDLPIILEVVDSEEKIAELKKMLDSDHPNASMLITEEKVKIIRYGKDIT
jgi:PII-like signaling protein